MRLSEAEAHFSRRYPEFDPDGALAPPRTGVLPRSSATGSRSSTAGSARRPSGSPSAWQRPSQTPDRFLCFLQGFTDRSVAEINQTAFAAAPRHAARVAA